MFYKKVHQVTRRRRGESFIGSASLVLREKVLKKEKETGKKGKLWVAKGGT